MTPLAQRGLVLTGGFIVLVAALSAALVKFDSAGARGVAVGVALGLVNLVVGSLLTRRTLRKEGMTSATANIVGGFGVRLVVLVALFLLFKQSSAVSATAFALTFVAFFFVYLAVEILMVERFRAPGHA